MRIAIPSTFPSFRGGISQFNEALKSALMEAGHEVHVWNWKRQYPNALFPGKDQHDPELPSPYPRTMDSIVPSTWKATGEMIAAIAPDVVLVPFWHAALAPALAKVMDHTKQAMGQNPIQFIGLIHNAGSHDADWWDQRLTMYFLKRLDRCWTLSEEVSERISELHPKLPISTLFHPLYDHFPSLDNTISAKEKLHLPEHAEVILYFGLIRPYKGLELLLEAFECIESLEAKPRFLVIAGECYGDWGSYQKIIDASAARDRIQTHERFVSEREVGLFFGAADVVALPYRRASQSGVTAVALHYGKPIVASNVGGLAEYIQPGSTGELVPANDARSLALGIEKALSSSYSEEAFIAARERFSWSAFANQAFQTR